MGLARTKTGRIEMMKGLATHFEGPCELIPNLRQRIDPFKRFNFQGTHFLVISLIFLLATGCRTRPAVVCAPPPEVPKRSITRIGYAIQVGAFSNLGNAVRLTQTLQDRGLNAYYFLHRSGLYKARFGNFATKESAQRKADSLHATGVIHAYYIVGPGEYPTRDDQKNARTHLRNEIVRTAITFLGVPYRWGGMSPEDGFDCSGFAMAVYHLNGLNLPRSSREQWVDGSPVTRNRMSKGDLVFFATSGRRRISHVGIYVGEDKFIHAPGTGKRIRFDSLSNRYFRRRYLGARTYL
jgi:cell wall-associated NlpC family hydrolase